MYRTYVTPVGGGGTGRIWRRLVLIGMARRFAAMAIFLCYGVTALAQTSGVLSLTWQWGGQAVHRTVIAVSHVAKEGGGWFGIGQSPSIAGNLPNAMIVDGEVVPGAGEPGAVKLKIPEQELPPVKAGGQLAISYTEDRRAVCVAVPPVGLSGEALAAWLTDWRCQPAM